MQGFCTTTFNVAAYSEDIAHCIINERTDMRALNGCYKL